MANKKGRISKTKMKPSKTSTFIPNLAKPVKTKELQYKPTDLEKAILAFRRGDVSLCESAKRFGVPKATLYRRIKCPDPGKSGPKKLLNNEEEQHLIDIICSALDFGYSLTKVDILNMVKQYFRQTKPSDGDSSYSPSNKWFYSFLKCHKELKLRTYHSIKQDRAKIISPQIIQKYFDFLSKSVEGVKSDLIVSCNETVVHDDPKDEGVIAFGDRKTVEQILDSSKLSISVMFAGSASGQMLPPYIVYKAKSLFDTWTENGPESASYAATQSGWFENATFEDWFFSICLPFYQKIADQKEPKILICDNVSSHLSLKILESSIENNVRLVFLPPQSTNLCQPLDAAFFSPLKAKWGEVLNAHKLKTKEILTKCDFPFLLEKTIKGLGDKVSSNLIAGFKATGICPLNPKMIFKKLHTTII